MPASDMTTDGMVKLLPVAPVISEPSFRHWYERDVPLAYTEKVAELPTALVWLDGPDLIVGIRHTVLYIALMILFDVILAIGDAGVVLDRAKIDPLAVVMVDGNVKEKLEPGLTFVMAALLVDPGLINL